MKGNLLLGTVYVSPINSCVYNSVNEREATIRGPLYVSPINSCVYNSVNGMGIDYRGRYTLAL